MIKQHVVGQEDYQVSVWLHYLTITYDIDIKWIEMNKQLYSAYFEAQWCQDIWNNQTKNHSKNLFEKRGVVRMTIMVAKTLMNGKLYSGQSTTVDYVYLPLEASQKSILLLRCARVTQKLKDM